MQLKKVNNFKQDEYKERLESIGYGFHTDENGVQYWVDDRYMSITPDFADRLYDISNSLWEKCLKAVDHVIENNLFDKFHIPTFMIPHIKDSWENDSPSIYGRFDFGYDPKTNKIKMLEFNADTPTSLFESGVVQWNWKEYYFPNQPNIDQFSTIHERLIEYWRELLPHLKGEVLHFTCVQDSLEDLTTLQYIRDCAMQAGIETKMIFIDDIGWDGFNFIDEENEIITDIFKLYPWEWMVHEEFGNKITLDTAKANWIEPSWKMILSNKAILPILHELFPDDENILECYFDSPEEMKNYVEKPLLSREGANVTIFKDNQQVQASGGEYGDEGMIYQEFVDLYSNEYGSYIIGSWIIGQESVGISFRESNGLITDNMSRYIPHIIEN